MKVIKFNTHAMAKIILEQLCHEDVWSDLDLVPNDKYKRCFFAIAQMAASDISESKDVIYME